MVYLEFCDGKSDKFWQIEQKDNSLFTSWGRKGTQGQSQRSDYASEAEATASYNKQVAAKKKKGYQEQATSVAHPEPGLAIKSLSEPASAAQTKTTSRTKKNASIEPDTKVSDTASSMSLTASKDLIGPELVWTEAQKRQKLQVLFSNATGEFKALQEPERDPNKAFKLLKNDCVDLFKTIASSEPAEFMQTVKDLKPMFLNAQAPSEWTQDMAGLLFTLARRRFVSDYLVSQRGFLWTLQAAIRSLDIEWIWGYPESKLKITSAQREMYTVPMSWAVLQEDFKALEAATQDEIRAYVEMQRPSISLEQRIAYDLILLHSPWIDADLREWLDLYQADPIAKVIGLLLMPYATQADLLNPCAKAFLKLSTQDGRQQMIADYLSQRVFVMLDRAQSQAAEALGLWSLSAKPAALRKRAAEALSYLRSPVALAVMASHLKAPESKLFVSRLQAEPEMGLRALLEHFAQKPGDEAAERLMQAMLQQNPDWQATGLSPKAAKLWQSLGDEQSQQERLAEASLADLPKDFLKPPTFILPAAFAALKIICQSDSVQPSQFRDLHPYVHSKPPVVSSKDAEYRVQLETQLGKAKNDLDDLDRLSQAAALDFFNARLISPDGLSYDPQAQSKANNWYSYRSDNWESDCILERFGLAGLNGLIAYAWEFLPAFKTLARIRSARLAYTMLRGLERSEIRSLCAHWMYTYPLETALGLIPIVLHPDSPASTRRLCAYALCQLWLKQSAIVRQALESYESLQTGSIAYFEVILSQARQLDVVDTKLKLPKYWDATFMPPLVLQNLSKQFPISLIDQVAEACARSTLLFESSKLQELKSLCTATSLAQFSRRIFTLWLDNGAKGKDEWMLHQIAYLADDSLIHDLAALMAQWPGERAHARAMAGLDVLLNLARQGRVAALAAIHQLSLKCRFQALREAAEKALREFADEQNQSLEQVLDQVVPDCGFDQQGQRSFRVGEEVWQVKIDTCSFKVQLQAPDGKPQSKWPTSGTKEQEKAWKSLKKEIDALLQSQILRLERAMVQQQIWQGARFESYLLQHPVLRHLIQTLVWGWRQDAQSPWQAFEVKYLDSHDSAAHQTPYQCLDASECVLSMAQGEIRLMHPIELQTELSHWQKRLGSVQQPFEQLNRQVFWPDAADFATTDSPAFQARQVSAARLLQLSKQGLWKSLGEGEFERYFGSQRVMICSEIAAYALNEYKEVELFYIHALNASHQPLPMGLLDPISYSELRRDLAWLGTHT